jgi:hypothetical protein
MTIEEQLPVLTPGDLRLTVHEMRSAVSLGELKPGLVRLPVTLAFGVYGWEFDGFEETFTLFRLVSPHEWRRRFKEAPEDFDARRLRALRVDSAHPHGMKVQTPDGLSWIIDETTALRVRSPNPRGNPLQIVPSRPRRLAGQSGVKHA